MDHYRARARLVEGMANALLAEYVAANPLWLQQDPVNRADLSVTAAFVLDATEPDGDHIQVTVSEAAPGCRELPLHLSRDLEAACPGEAVTVRCEW